MANTWQLQVAATANATTELNTSVDDDKLDSTGITYGTGVGTYFEPVAATTTLACGNYTPEYRLTTSCRTSACKTARTFQATK